MNDRKITGINDGTKSHYVCGEKDPRKTPLNQCVSLGDLMATLQICEELDELDDNKKKGKRKKK